MLKPSAFSTILHTLLYTATQMATLTKQTSGSLKLVGTALGTLIVRAPHTGIQYLPIEILDLVLEHLSIEEVVRLSLVSLTFVAVRGAVR